MNTLPTITVVILTSDRPALLEKALDSIHRQTVKPIEVVIVDGSTHFHNETIAIIKQHTRTLHIIKRNTKHSIPYGRMLGAKTAHGSIVVYLDDDCIAEPSYLARFAHHFQRDPQLTAVVGMIRNTHPDNIYAATQYAYYLRGLKHFFPTLRTAEPIRFGRILDCEVMGAKRKTLLLFGFPERHRKYRNDDVELGLRFIAAKKKLYFDPKITAWATPRRAFFPLLTAAFWNGHSDACTSKIYRVNLRQSPYPTKFFTWFFTETIARKDFRGTKKIAYLLLLLLFPFVSRLGKLWYHMSSHHEHRNN